MRNKLLIPLSSAVALTCQGCADPVIGDWQIVEALDVTLPGVLSYSSGEVSYDLEISGLGLSVNANLGGNLKFRAVLDIDYYGATYHYDLTYTYDVGVSTLDKRSRYDIRLENDVERFDLDCAMTGRDTLECEDQDDRDWEFFKP